MAGKHRRAVEPDEDGLVEGSEPLDAASPVTALAAASARSSAATMVGSDAGSAGAAGPASVSLLPTGPAQTGASASGAIVVPGHASARRAVREQRSQRARRVKLAAAAVVAVLVAAAAWYATSSSRGAADASSAAPVGRAQQTLLLQVVDAHHATVAAVLLAHDRTGAGTGFGALIPATLLVNASGLGSVPLGQTTTAGGPTVGPAAVADAIGVSVDGGWALPVTGLASLVDAVGGVDVTVDEDITQAAASGAAVVLIPAGQRHLGGQQAALFATFLDSGAPEQLRLARLSAVLQALLAKLPASDAPLSALVGSLVSPGGASMPPGRISALLGLLRSDAAGGRLSFDNLPTHPLDIGGSAPALVVDNNALPAFVKSDFADSVPTNSAGAPFSVLVQNGVGTPGLDDTARRRLAGAGISFVNGANASSFNNPTSTVLIADGSDAAQRRGAAVAKALGLPATDIKITDQGQTLVAVVVILGGDFKP